MATQNTGGPNDPLNSGITDQQLQQINYNDYLSAGGNPSLAYADSTNQILQGSPPNPYDPTGGGYGGAYSSASYKQYAPYDEGSGHTKWDEFVQQMAYNNQKLAQDAELKRQELKNAIDVENIRAAQQKYGTDTTAVDSFDKNLFAQQGPKDPYGYLFQSRGLASPQGYAPVGMPLAQGVRDAYSAQGINLADAQKSIVGSSGPSFVSGYLGSMPTANQQGPMGFQNTPAFKDVAPGSQPQPQNTPTPTPGQQGPPKMAQGGVIGGFAPGQDTVPAFLSPGEGVLNPSAVQAVGGPASINMMNAQNPPSRPPQEFASGGVVQPDAIGTGGVAPITGGFGGASSGRTVTPTQNGGNFQIAGQNVGQNSVENAPPPGYTMTSPGVASQNSGNSARGGPSGIASFMGGGPSPNSNGWINAIENHFSGRGWFGGGQSIVDPTGGSQSAGNPGVRQGPSGVASFGGDRGVDLMQGQQGGIRPGLHPLPAQGPGIGGWGGNTPLGNPNAPNLTGGVQTPVAPVGGSPINLNMLDPYTRSLVDQYGRPESPSMQAWSEMPQSGKDAYTNYVEKVAGGNMQDLLDQQKNLTPQGDAAALRNTLSFK